MRKECKTLHEKAVDSLVLAVDHFNRAWDRGRTELVLILLDRAFELLLKAIIVHLAGGGAIREKNKEGMTIGFDHCLRKCLSNSKMKCLSDEDVIALQALNTLRDAAQHYTIELSEEHLYIYAQAALTLFGRLTKDVLNRPLAREVPQRMLPICAKPPTDLASLFDIEFADIKRMVVPRSRKSLDAKARLRSLAILQSSLDGKKSQPSDVELDKVVKRVKADDDWRVIFPGVATLKIVPDAVGAGLSLRITKSSGEAVHLVPEGTPDATVVAVRRVNELDYYSQGVRSLAQQLKVKENQLLWYISETKMQESDEYFKLIRIGKSSYKRYSRKCLEVLRDRLKDQDLNALWLARAARQDEPIPA